MKKITLFIAIIFSVCIKAQTPMFSKKDIVPMLAQFSGCAIAGSFRASVEVLDNSYISFQKKFPGANPNRWNPDITWTQKYKNSNPNEGPAFPGSTTIFVCFTDPKHGFQAIEHSALFITTSFTIGGSRDRELWKQDKLKYLGKKAVQCAVLWCGYNVGFTLTHDYFFKAK